MKSRGKGNQFGTMILLAGLLTGIFTIYASVYAENTDQADKSVQFIAPEGEVQGSEYVTMNVKDADITEVLTAYSLQTGQSIVIGPDVVAEKVNVRLNNRPWQEALDVILKPYGFGYSEVGETIMVRKLENIMTVEDIEPLESKVFKLKYLDAYDVKEVCEAQLTARGKFTILTTKGLPGWKFGSSGANARRSGRTAASNLGIQERAKKEDLDKSKTIVVTDVPSSVAAVEAVINDLDQVPAQVLIEARFIEIGADALKEIGLDFITGLEEVSGTATTLAGTPSVDDMANIITVLQGYPDPLSMGSAGKYGMDTGLRLSHTQLGESGVEMLIKLMQKDQDANVLSAPRILTLDNQEASILVGKKFPIIESDTSGEQATRTSTSLEYYENIGIQLNVIPQVCDDSYVNMIVHPSVSEIDSFTDGRVQVTGVGQTEGTSYPILIVREAETQILLKSKDTTVIGGLQQERDVFTVKRVPFLGDIPYLGRLFRKEETNKKKIELLIFIKASIIDPEEYAVDSTAKKEKMEETSGLGKEEENSCTTEGRQAQCIPADNGVKTEVAPIVKIEDAAPAVADAPVKKSSPQVAKKPMKKSVPVAKKPRNQPAPKVAKQREDDTTEILKKMVAEAEAEAK